MWLVGRPQNLFLLFFLYENNEICDKKKKEGKNDKKSSQSAVIDSPGRSTGNNIFSKGGLVHNACLRTLTDSEVGVGELHGDGIRVPRDLDVGVET